MTSYKHLSITCRYSNIVKKEARINWSLMKSTTHHTLLPPYHHDCQKEIIYKLKHQQLLLPILFFLNLTQPHIYKDDLRCPVYLDQLETWSHIFLYTPQQSSMQICIDLTMN